MINMKQFITTNINKILLVFLLILLLLSRFYFLGGHIQFFDSSQYIWRSESKDLITALTTGHAPYHPGYIFLTWSVNQIFLFLNIHNTSLACAIPSAIAGIIAITFFYLLVKDLFNKKTALLSAGIAALIPFFWIANISIIVDPTMIASYIVSLYLFHLWLNKRKYIYLILAGFALGYSMWAHTQIAFWSLGFVGLFLAELRYKEWLKMFFKSLFFVIGIIFFIYIYLYLLVYSGHNPTYFSALKYLLGGNAGDHMPFNLVAGTKNYLVIVTAFLVILSIGGFIKLFIDKKYKQLGFLLLWLVPGLYISALYLYANLYGRSSMISIFPAAIAVAYLFISWQSKNLLGKICKYLLIILVFAQLLYISLPIANNYKTKPAPFEELADLHKKLKPDGLYITSNSAKTIYNYKNIDVIWEMSKVKIDNDVKEAFSNKKPVYVGLDAVTFSNYKYDGYNWEIDSAGVGGPGDYESLAQFLFSKYNLVLDQTSNYQYKTGIYEVKNDNTNIQERISQSLANLGQNENIIIGQLQDENLQLPIARNTLNFYSQKEKLIISPERINYHDWVYYLYNQLTYKIKKNNNYREPLLWTLSDKSGYFSLPLPKDQSDNIDLVITTPNFSTAGVLPDLKNITKFSVEKNTLVEINNVITGETNSVDDLIKIIPPDKSYFLKISKENNNIFYQLNVFNFGVELSSKIFAPAIPANENTQIIDNIRYVTQNNTGYVAFGPWISLPKGQYEIKFRVKIDKTDDKKKAGNVEITADECDKSLAQKELYVADFTNDFQDITLGFSADHDLEGVEFKLKSSGAVNWYLESIELRSL